MKRHEKGFYGWAIYAYADKFGCRPSGKVDWNARAPISEEVKNYMTYRNIRYAHRRKKENQKEKEIANGNQDIRI